MPWTWGQRRQGRDEVKELTGQINLPVLLLDEGKTVFRSSEIVKWAKAHPARPAGDRRRMTTSLADLKLHGSGKVREIYEDGDELIMVASDRISVYDVILPTEIPDKGKVLTQMSLFWFELTGDIVPNHFISEDVPPGGGGRGMRVTKLEMYPIECVVRGYLSGSGWREYQESGAVCGIELPDGLDGVRASCPSRSSRRRPRPSSASTTRTSTSTARSRSSATGR